MGKYLRKFDTHSQYEMYINSQDKLLPNVSLCEDQKDLHYNKKPHDYSQDYLTFVIKTSGTFDIYPAEASNVYYSLNNGETWVDFSQGGTITVSAGDKLMWKGILNNDEGKYWDKEEVEPGVHFDVQGNIMSLVYGDNFKGQTDLTGKALGSVFSELQVENAKNLILPATTLEESCYYDMFSNCTSLITAPVLPATTLANECYMGMFYHCTSLVTAPELPATTLANRCYSGMFDGCIALTTAPELLATTLTNRCYYYMFFGCTSLTTAPELPATTLAEHCYDSMFDNCTALTTAPVLPATTLADSCYYYMFRSCTSLTTAPELPATTLVSGCYGSMFKNCTNLNYIKAMFTTTPGTSYTQDWVKNVSATGTFVKNSAAQWNVSGDNGIPTLWEVIPETRVVARFNVTDTSNATNIMYDGSIIQFSEIEIDGVVQPSVISSYTFSTTGEHIVKYTLTNTLLGVGAFKECNNLTSVNIPDGVTKIGTNALRDCTSLASVTIPNSVTEIASNAFNGCSNLTSIVCNATTAPTIQANTFQNIKTGGTLTVPTSSTGYNVWMNTGDYYLGKYSWTKIEQ